LILASAIDIPSTELCLLALVGEDIARNTFLLDLDHCLSDTLAKSLKL
jgi:hypothetical protein